MKQTILLLAILLVGCNTNNMITNPFLLVGCNTIDENHASIKLLNGSTIDYYRNTNFSNITGRFFIGNFTSEINWANQSNDMNVKWFYKNGTSYPMWTGDLSLWNGNQTYFLVEMNRDRCKQLNLTNESIIYKCEGR